MLQLGMPKLSPISALKLLKILEKQGFMQIRQRGSHLRLVHTDGRKTVVPMHGGEHVGVGLLKKIIRDTQLPTDLFRK